MDRTIKLTFLKLSPILLLLWPITTSAGIFDPPVTDLSVQYIGNIFGGSVGGISLGTTGAANPFLGSLFQAFNGVILAVAIFILSYVSSIGIINTAHQGEVMGKKWSSVWIPLRSMGGLLLLAPVPGSGYSLLQVTVMWIILNGIGAADKIWNLTVDNLAQGISPVQSAQLNSGDTNLIQQVAQTAGPIILQNLVCLQIVGKNINTGVLSTVNNTLGPNFIDASSSSGTIHFGAQDLSNPSDTANLDICGNIQFSGSASTGELPGATSAQASTIATYAYQVKKQALSSMISYLSPIATEIANVTATSGSGPISLPSDLQAGLLFPAISIYTNLLSDLTQQSALVQLGLANETTTSVNSVVTNNVANAKTQGWITAGSFYFLLNQSASQNLLATATKSMTTNTYATGYTFTTTNLQLNATAAGQNLQTLFQPYATAMNNNPTITSLFQNVNTTTGLGGQFHFVKSWGDLDSSFQIVSAMSPLFLIAMAVERAVQAFMNGIMEMSGDPLLGHARLGANLMYAAELGFGIAGAATIGSTAIAAICAAESPMGAVAANALITVLLPLLPLLAMVWVMGASLAIYLPMVPYMMFAIASLGWLMLVIEAIVAAPIVALGLILPSQDELGEVKPALGIIASLFLRPMLMIVGLIMSSKIYDVMIQLIMFGFTNSISILISESNNQSLFACVPIAVLYVGLVIALENKCFQLIYQLPDKILRWIGVQGDQTDMSALQEAKQTYDAHAKDGVQPIQGGTTGLMNKAKEANGMMGGDLGGGGGGGGEEEGKGKAGKGGGGKG
jgi:conjugal transfer/type IV secretion protein DotA/TraY